VFAGAAFGTPVIGVLGFTGNGVLTFQQGASAFVDWCPSNTGSPAGCNTTDNSGTGSILVTSNSGGLTVVPVGSVGTILDQTNTTPPTPPYTYFPPGVPVAINNYLNFASDPAGWNWQANLLLLQACNPGEFCVGPFKFTQNTGSVSVSIEVNGTLFSPAAESRWRALITGNFIDPALDTIPEVLAAAQTAGGAYSPSWSATLVTDTIPEPGTFGLMGGALVLFGSLSTRLRRRK